MEKSTPPIKLYEYSCKWGDWDLPSAESYDYGYYSFVTPVNEDEMKERLRAYANEVGDKYDVYKFLLSQTDGWGFQDINLQGGWSFEKEVDLDKISLEDLVSSERMSEILAERQRKEEEKRAKAKQEQDATARRSQEYMLQEILRKRPDLVGKVVPEGMKLVPKDAQIEPARGSHEWFQLHEDD